MTALAASVGVRLSIQGGETAGLPHLYVQVAEGGAGDVVYVGKQDSSARTRNEAVWASRAEGRPLDRFVTVSPMGRPMMVSAWTATIAANASVSVDLWLSDFDVDQARAAIAEAAAKLARAHADREELIVKRYAEREVSDARSAFARFLEYDFVTPSASFAWFEQPERIRSIEVEKFLVRLAVRTGRPIANSQYAGQWESLLDTPADTLAALAHILAEPERPDSSFNR